MSEEYQNLEGEYQNLEGECQIKVDIHDNKIYLLFLFPFFDSYLENKSNIYGHFEIDLDSMENIYRLEEILATLDSELGVKAYGKLEFNCRSSYKKKSFPGRAEICWKEYTFISDNLNMNLCFQKKFKLH